MKSPWAIPNDPRIVAGTAPIPLWVCLCGARNRLRDLQCRSCGGPKP